MSYNMHIISAVQLLKCLIALHVHMSHCTMVGEMYAVIIYLINGPDRGATVSTKHC